MFRADKAPAGTSEGELEDRLAVVEDFPEGDLVPGLEVDTFGLKVTVLFTPGDFLELVGAGGIKGVVSVPDGMIDGEI